MILLFLPSFNLFLTAPDRLAPGAFRLPDRMRYGRIDGVLSEKKSNKVYGVGELTETIRGLLRPLEKIYLEGEISGWKLYPSGHAYFTAKDGSAQISCVMFSSALQRCKAAERLRDGAKVCLYGRIDVYPARGNYQFVVLAAKIAGEGDLMAKFMELKERLAGEGLFESSRKRPLPFLPHRIGIVTSSAGAVIHDMCNVFYRRFPNLEIRLYPVKVQGPGAKEEIAEGVEFFNRCGDWKADVLIVGRGGGSFEDLWAFNEECVVRAVASSRIPVVSAVGHESDFTLCDYAADVRAGTPSIAAEMTVPDKSELVAKVRDLAGRLRRSPEHAFEIRAQKTDHLGDRLASALKDALVRSESRLARAAQSLVPDLKEAVIRAESRLSAADRRLSPVIDSFTAALALRLSTASAKLGLLDPGGPLKRGYSLTLDATGRIVRDSSELAPGALITTRLGKGEVKSRVEA